MSDNECNADEEDRTPGIFSWRELVSRDPGASKEFYTELLGWTSQEVEMPIGTYTMFMAGERPVAGLVQLPAEKAEASTTWIDYITVEDLDVTVAKAESLGAKLCMPPTEVPGKGRFAGLADPQGAPIAFWEFAK